MAQQRPNNPNGAQNGPNPSAQPPRFSRPFTLQEALPFSPFSSVISFESGMFYEKAFERRIGSRLTNRQR